MEGMSMKPGNLLMPELPPPAPPLGGLGRVFDSVSCPKGKTRHADIDRIIYGRA